MKDKKEPLVINNLTGRRKEEALNLLKSYKFVFFCMNKSCRRVYGSDKPTDNGYCPICESVLFNKKAPKKHKRNTIKYKDMVLC